MTPLKRQMMIVFVSFLACILAIGVCCSVSRSQTKSVVTPAVDPGIAHHEDNELKVENELNAKGKLRWVMADGTGSSLKIDAEVPKATAVVIEGEGVANTVTVPKGSYIVVITPPPQPLVLEPQDPKNTPIYTPRFVPGLFNSEIENKSMVGGGVPPVPTFLVTADKTKTEITVRAFCPAGYIVELPYLGWTENAPERLQAILNSKCETSRFVRPGDMTPTLTFTLNLRNWSKDKK